jgi:hypothetical protein
MALAAALLGLALTAPVRAPATAPPPAPCTRFRVQAEKNDLAPDAEVAAWTSAALDHRALLDPASPCFVHVRITAGPIRTGGKEDGFVAHVAASTRRLQRDGKLVTREKGMLFVEARRDAVIPRVRAFVDDFVAGLATTAAAAGAPAAPTRPAAAPPPAR